MPIIMLVRSVIELLKQSVLPSGSVKSSQLLRFVAEFRSAARCPQKQPLFIVCRPTNEADFGCQ
jgi:hypothetical protein